MTNAFRTKLNAAISTNDSLLCVGLDPDPTLMPIADVARFTREIIAATADFVCCYKPNIAFYEALGAEGWEALRQTLAAVPANIPVILDAKRGDIGNTAAAYAKSVFDVLGADAVTVNVYTGFDGVEPFLEYEDRGIFVLCHSSNPSAGDFQDLETDFRGQSRPVWQVVALRAKEWNEAGNVGLVIGATYSSQLGDARALCPDMPILVPGVGAQEGSLADAVRAGLDADGAGIVVNASRGVIYASRDKEFAAAAGDAAHRLRDAINRHRRGVVARLEG